uniref:tRNA(Ile2) 2-agmatinylcytidine synthetase TiaS n=1 Tax=uncultured marine thaumarchaeote KM3_44_H07 TaxID=1456153 RepID=A0A075H2B4_9ARCH|nr:putative DNA-binding protein containing a Zn-ribbon domain [uncultured marine thaumarchaeote KM3_44_H07]
MLKNSTILHIGIDDTDSPKGMCTTFLSYKIVKFLEKQKAEFVDYPSLIRFNPNIPWKTRGNGAVRLTIKTRNPNKIKKEIIQFIKNYSDTKNGANPGLVFFQDQSIPQSFHKFSRLALWKLISRKTAKDFISNNKIDSFYLGNGQGLVGAIGAIGYKFSDHTFELLCYRKKSQFGKKRIINEHSVKKMQSNTFPETYNSFDNENDRVLITPHGPDPVFYGIRGESVKSVVLASTMVDTDEKLDGYMVFKSNQGTADHLKNELQVNDLKPYTSGFLVGKVCSKPITEQGGHVFFSIQVGDRKIRCGVYKQTKITKTAQDLIPGDKIRLGGGIRKASKNYERVLNVEFLDVIKLEKNILLTNPTCKTCNKKMKSKGNRQGFECFRCGNKSFSKSSLEIPRKIQCKLYLPAISAHRHLTRPYQRLKKRNKFEIFDTSLEWLNIF